MKMPVANSKTRTSYEGALSAKPGVPGSGGRPTPGGAHSISVGSIRGWMQVQPAADSWPGVTPSAFAGRAVAPAAPDDETLVRLARQGSRPACDELFYRHRGVAFRVAYRLLGHEQDALDAGLLAVHWSEPKSMSA